MFLPLILALLVFAAKASQIQIHSGSNPSRSPDPHYPTKLGQGENWRAQEGLVFPMRGFAPKEKGGKPVPLYDSMQVPYELAINTERYGMDLHDPIAIKCCPGDRSNFFHDVSQPHFVPFLDVRGPRKTDAGVLVFPGGGFHFMAWEKEGTDIAVWLNSIGIRAFVLKYRVPYRGLVWHAALQDAQRAMSLIRANASEFGVNPRRIGTIGFSAGGKLAMDLSSSIFRTYPARDQADNEHWYPNFQLLIYGWGDFWDFTGPNSIKPPPTFLTVAEDDQCVSANSVRTTATAIKNAGGIVDLHVYPDGRHGYGRCTMYTESGNWHSVCEWPQHAEKFLVDHVLNDSETEDLMYHNVSAKSIRREPRQQQNLRGQ